MNTHYYKQFLSFYETAIFVERLEELRGAVDGSCSMQIQAKSLANPKPVRSDIFIDAERLEQAIAKFPLMP